MRLGDLEVTLDPALAGRVCVGLVLARACSRAVDVGGEVKAAEARVAEIAANEDAKKAARDMLRFGKYKPTGRGKPASEYLLQAALEGGFPRIDPLVDLCNGASLEALLPISLIDLERAATTSFLVRRGRAEERYVFNAGGQTIELEDLLLTARMPADEPCANAVKDSLATKLGPIAKDVLAVIYAPESRAAAAAATAEALAERYRRMCSAEAMHALLRG